MRGKATGMIGCIRVKGITPAHAGKSLLRIGPSSTSWDHPRTCGEKNPSDPVMSDRWGSPPHMRGKVTFLSYSRVRRGITPAHAGKSCCVAAHQVVDRDHPRTCGEKPIGRCMPGCAMGSPPHMRGKVDHQALVRDVHRITPAHAGKRPTLTTAAAVSRDHPRTCGEKSALVITPRFLQGSPPHMRGKE